MRHMTMSISKHFMSLAERARGNFKLNRARIFVCELLHKRGDQLRQRTERVRLLE